MQIILYQHFCFPSLPCVDSRSQRDNSPPCPSLTLGHGVTTSLSAQRGGWHSRVGLIPSALASAPPPFPPKPGPQSRRPIHCCSKLGGAKALLGLRRSAPPLLA